MSEAPAYYGKADATGKLAIDCPALAGRYVVVRERKAIRSVAQNRLYWRIITLAADSLGYEEPEQLHEGVASKLLALPEIVAGMPRRRRTPRLNTDEFSAYIDKAQAFLIHMGADLSRLDDMGDEE